MGRSLAAWIVSGPVLSGVVFGCWANNAWACHASLIAGSLAIFHACVLKMALS